MEERRELVLQVLPMERVVDRVVLLMMWMKAAESSRFAELMTV